MSKTKIVITFDNTINITTTVATKDLRPMENLDLNRPLILEEDNNGVAIWVNLEHVKSIQYIKQP